MNSSLVTAAQMVSSEFALTSRDYLVANLRHLSRSWIFWFFFGLIGPLNLYFGIRQVIKSPSEVNSYLFQLVFGIMFTIFLPVSTVVNSFTQFKKQRLLTGEKRVSISANGLSVESAEFSGVTSWPVFTEFDEISSLFILYQHQRVFVLLPKRAFGSQDAVDSVRALLRKNIKLKRTKLAL